MINFDDLYNNTITEIGELFCGINPHELQQTVNLICSGNFDTIVGFGAGRMGYAMRAFIMRLSHIGFNAYMIGDTSFPRIGQRTLILVNSSSGETPTSLLYAQQAKNEGGYLICVSQNSDSTLGKMSDQIIQYPMVASKQIMKTLPEQFTFILFDVLSEAIIRQLNKNRAFISNNHSISE